MSDYTKDIVKQLKPHWIARCILENNDEFSYEKYLEDKLLHGLKCKDIDFYKKIIRSQFKQIRSAEKAYRAENNGNMKFTSDHHYYFILARHAIRPLLYTEVDDYLKFYKDLGLYGHKAKSTYTEPEPPVYTSPAPVYTSPAPVYTSPAPVYTSPAPVYTRPDQSLIITKEMDNKPVVMISVSPKPILYNMYSVV